MGPTSAQLLLFSWKSPLFTIWSSLTTGLVAFGIWASKLVGDNLRIRLREDPSWLLPGVDKGLLLPFKGVGVLECRLLCLCADDGTLPTRDNTGVDGTTVEST